MTQHRNLSGDKLHEPFSYVQDDDPGAVGAGKYWLDTSSEPYALKRRNEADDDWVEIGGGGSAVSYPKTWTMWHDQSKVTNGNAIRKSNNSNQPYGRYADQNAPANGDISENGFYVAAGTYTLKMLIIKETDTGKLDISIDGGSVIGTIDFYGSLAWGQEVSISSVVISTDGYHKLVMTVNGKNASSSDYHCYITKMWLEPSAY